MPFPGAPRLVALFLVLLSCSGEAPADGPGAGGPATSGGAADAAGPATSGGAGGAGGAAGDGECSSLAPSADGADNVARITSCLESHGHALLADGDFPLARGLRFAAATLAAAPGAAPTLRIVNDDAAPTHYALVLDGQAEVRGLRIDTANRLEEAPTSGAVLVNGDGNVVEGNEIFAGSPPPPGHHATGVYFVCEACRDNVVRDNDIRHFHYGAIFRGTLDADHPNTLEGNRIRDVKCDGVTLAGFGRVVGNEVHRVGYDCENGPIPGAAVYALNNAKGAEILDNDLHDTCGHVVDLDRVAHFVLRGNKARDPGYRWEGAHPHCGGGATFFLLDVRESIVEENWVENRGRPQNAQGPTDPNHVFSAGVDDTHADLPLGKKQVIAFVLARRRGEPNAFYAVHNQIRRNTFRAFCEPATLCGGLGYFTSRDTGRGPGGAWSAATTNYFTENDPFGSQVGSKRCGANWYAANSTCDGKDAGGDCNTDDFQHNPPGADSMRNDLCDRYP